MISALPVQQSLDIVPPPFREHELIARPMLIGHHLLPEIGCSHQQIVDKPRRAPRLVNSSDCLHASSRGHIRY